MPSSPVPVKGCLFSLCQVLWPYLLEFIVPVGYTRSLGIVCRCVADIAAQKRENDAEDYNLDFEELGMFVPLYMCMHFI